MISKLAAAWPLLVKRSIAHWRLLLSVVIGVLMASAMMAGTVIYFEALRELALESSIAKLTSREADVLVKAERGPTTVEEYVKVADAVVNEASARVQWMLRDSNRGGKTATFFLSQPGQEDDAGEDNARTFFAFLPEFAAYASLGPLGRMPSDEALCGVEPSALCSRVSIFSSG